MSNELERELTGQENFHPGMIIRNATNNKPRININMNKDKSLNLVYWNGKKFCNMQDIKWKILIGEIFVLPNDDNHYYCVTHDSYGVLVIKKFKKIFMPKECKNFRLD